MEYWVDTKWEPYKEDIQHQIRKHFDKHAQDLQCGLEINIDLDYGNEEWMYTVYVFPQKDVPPDIVDPMKQRMIDKAKRKTSSPSTPTSGSAGTRVTRQGKGPD